jgi:hypothetical protein
MQIHEAAGPIYTARHLFNKGEREESNPFDLGSQKSVDFIVEMNRLVLEQEKEEARGV